MGKGEIARYKQLLLFPQCFQKACFPGASKGVIVWEWVNRVKLMEFVFRRKENIVSKGELAGYQHFLLFPNCLQKTFSKGLTFSVALFDNGLSHYPLKHISSTTL